MQLERDVLNKLLDILDTIVEVGKIGEVHLQPHHYAVIAKFNASVRKKSIKLDDNEATDLLSIIAVIRQQYSKQLAEIPAMTDHLLNVSFPELQQLNALSQAVATASNVELKLTEALQTV